MDNKVPASTERTSEVQETRELYEARAREQQQEEARRAADDMLKYNSAYQNLGIGQFIDLVA